MPNPEPQPCGLCEYKTPAGCPTWRDANEALRLHVDTFHNALVHRDARGSNNEGGAGAKAEKLRRPTLEEEISPTDWNFFKSKWNRYKRSAKLSGQDVLDQLWACMSDGLERQCHDHGASVDTTTEEQLLELMKAMSIRGVNKLCNVVEFLNLKQNETEPIQKFISRVRGQALTCDFKIKCSKVGCSQESSYADKLSSHIIVRGLYDPDIQEDVLKIAATTEEDLDLKKITEVVLAQETGIRSRKLLNDEMGLHQLSQHKKQKQNRHADARVLNEKCAHCGEFGHGYSASAEVREALCPAFGKQCSNCKFNNHYASLCKKQRVGKANALESGERSSKASSESDSEKEVGGMGFFNTLKTEGRPSSPSGPSSDSHQYDADSDSSSLSSSKGNTDGENFEWFSMTMVNGNKSQMNKKKKVAHHEASQRGKWIKSGVKPQVTVKASALQRVLHQPASQQGTETPGTQWKEIDSVVGTLIKLSLQYSAYRNNFRGGGHNQM